MLILIMKIVVLLMMLITTAMTMAVAVLFSFVCFVCVTWTVQTIIRFLVTLSFSLRPSLSVCLPVRISFCPRSHTPRVLWIRTWHDVLRPDLFRHKQRRVLWRWGASQGGPADLLLRQESLRRPDLCLLRNRHRPPGWRPRQSGLSSGRMTRPRASLLLKVRITSTVKVFILLEASSTFSVPRAPPPNHGFSPRQHIYHAPPPPPPLGLTKALLRPLLSFSEAPHHRLSTKLLGHHVQSRATPVTVFNRGPPPSPFNRAPPPPPAFNRPGPMSHSQPPPSKEKVQFPPQGPTRNPMFALFQRLRNILSQVHRDWSFVAPPPPPPPMSCKISGTLLFDFFAFNFCFLPSVHSFFTVRLCNKTNLTLKPHSQATEKCYRSHTHTYTYILLGKTVVMFLFDIKITQPAKSCLQENVLLSSLTNALICSSAPYLLLNFCRWYVYPFAFPISVVVYMVP